jgi:hypothetical protein
MDLQIPDKVARDVKRFNLISSPWMHREQRWERGPRTFRSWWSTVK